MHVYKALYCEARPARSGPENATKQFISLIIDVVDPPKLTDRHPVMSLNLEKALSTIQKSAEERLEVLKSKKKQVEQGESSVETVPKLIGHIEKIEAEEIEDEQEGDGGAAVAEEDIGGRQMAERGEAPNEEVTKQTSKSKKADKTENLKKKTRSTPSVSKLKEE